MKKKHFSPVYAVILCSILLTAIIVVVSLFAFFHSVTPEELKNSVRYARGGYMESQTTAPETEETESETASVPEETTTPETEKETEPSARALETTDEMGIASDLSVHDVPEDIYFVMLDTAMGPMMYFNQGDRRWADYLYGGEDPMEGYGCGPTAVAMLVSSFSVEGGGSTPVEIADWSLENGCYALHSGSYHSLIPRALTAYGFSVEGVTDRSRQNVSDLLSNGHVLVALMGKGTLTGNGHFILITQILENGNVRIADPNSYENSRKEWDPDLLLSELKKSYDNGGPLWAVKMNK